MARASDFEGIHRGLGSIRQSLLDQQLADYRAARDAEERGRYEAQNARQLKLDEDMRAWRAEQGQRAATSAAETKAFREWQQNRASVGDAEKAAATKAAAGKLDYFNTALRASEAGPAMQTLAGAVTSPDLNLGKGLPDLSGMAPQDFQPQPLTNERVLRAETAAGLATPQGAQQAAMGEEKLAFAISKAQEAKAALEEKLKAAPPSTGNERIFSSVRTLRAEALELERKGDAAGAALKRSEADRLEASIPDYRKSPAAAAGEKPPSIREEIDVQKLVDEKRAAYNDLMAKSPESWTDADTKVGAQLVADIEHFIAKAGRKPAAIPGRAGATNAAPAAAATILEGQTATNSRTGEKIIFRNGSWQPLK